MKKSTKHSKPYWTPRLTVLCDKMLEARKAYKMRNTDTRLQEMYDTKEEFDKARKEECEKFILEKTKNLNAAQASKFWKEFNKIFKKTAEAGIDPLKDDAGGLVTDNKEIEEKMFSTFFQCKHMIDADFDEFFFDSVTQMYEDIKTEDFFTEYGNRTGLNAPISIKEIEKAIKKTAGKRSFDNHQMHPKMLHQFGEKAIKVIQRLFSMSLNKGKWVWNNAEVIFLKKDGKESYAVPGSYRPISITSYIGKLLEKIIAARIIHFLIRRNFHDPQQEGFTSGRNTIRYLNRLNMEINTDILDGKTVIGLFMDLEKAFDSVWKKGLIVKLAKLNIKGNILKLIDSFLTTRTVILNINGNKGEERNCEEYGLPQGSALSPLLFKIYMMDILEDLEDEEEIELYKFADDGTIKIASESTELCKQTLDKVINSLSKWTKSNRMIINCNPNKTEFICFNTAENDANIPDSIQITGKTVKRVKQTKVLGLVIDEDCMTTH